MDRIFRVQSSINTESYLIRSIETISSQLDVVFGYILFICMEYKWIQKVQFNFVSQLGSLHVQYSNQTITYYSRGPWEGSCLLTVSLIFPVGLPHSSTVEGENALEAINNFLILSEQRSVKIKLEQSKLIRVELLPSSINHSLDTSLPEIEFVVQEGEAQQ